MVSGASPRPGERKSSYGSYYPTPVPDDEPTVSECEGPYDDVGMWSLALGSLMAMGL